MVRPCSLLLVLPLLAPCSLLGCGSEAAPAPQATPAAPTPAAPEPAKASEAPKVAPEPAAPVVPDTGPLGVAACDEYLAAYRTCIEGLAADARESHTKVVEGQRAAWGKAKADAKVASTLQGACTAARAAAKVALPDCKGW